jgi:hypothetical protein
MNTKMSLATLLAAAALAAGGVAFAQANPQTSTAGNNCTATGNAMRGGNLGGQPSNTACTDRPAANAAAPAATTAAPMAATTTPPSGSNMGAAPAADTTATAAPAAPAPAAPMRVARADRN